MRIVKENNNYYDRYIIPRITVYDCIYTTMSGPTALLGGFLIHLSLGTLYLWSNITIAVTSYLRSFDSTITYDDTLLVYASSLGTQGIFMLAGVSDTHIFYIYDVLVAYLKAIHVN